MKNGKEVNGIEVLDIEPDHFKSLKEKEKEFCREYLFLGNGTAAYQKVYGGIITSARIKAYELLGRRRIRMYCDYLNEDLEATTGISRTWIIEQHLRIVRCSIAHLHNSWIDRKAFEDLTPEQKDCIEEISTQTRTEMAEGEDGETAVQVDYVKIKLYNKQKALDSISKIMGYDAPLKIENKNFNLNVELTADEARKIFAAVEKQI